MAHQITDEELDRDWKPSGRRPQSTIARTFSQELMDIFRIENSVADLDEKLNERKQTVQTQTSELESLEKRIKEMEARLQRGGVHARTPLNTTTTTTTATEQTEAPRPPSTDDQLQQIQDKARSRPGTARQNQAAAPSSANMPPTPTASEDGDRS